MADIVPPERRSEMMRGIRSGNTRPEMLVRRWLHAKGYRYRIHAKNVPGSPDLVFPSRRLAVFIHGCYWHRHPSCKLAYTPKSNIAKWEAKFAENAARDARVYASLASLGWHYIVVWECQIRNDFAETMRILQQEIAEHVRHA